MYEDLTFNSQVDDSKTVAAKLRESGCILLRNALPRTSSLFAGQAVRDNARRLQEIVGKPVNDMPICFGDQYSSDPEMWGMAGHSLEKFTDPLTFSGMDRSWYYEGERNYKKWFWQHGTEFPNLILALVRESILPDVYEGYFEEQYLCSYAQSVVRYQRTDLRNQRYLFHQDGSYHTHNPQDHTGLTTWIPLTDCGTDAPSLQLYPYALDEVLPPPNGVKPPYLFCDETLVMERYGDCLWEPELRAGDALVFNAFVVHRSHITDDMTKERQSADVRVFPKSHVPAFVRAEDTWMISFK